MKIILSGIAAEKNSDKIFQYQGEKNTDELIKNLKIIYSELNDFQVYVSVNQQLALDNIVFSENDIIMVFNPFSGG